MNELLACNSNAHWKSMNKKDILVTIYGNGFVCPTLWCHCWLVLLSCYDSCRNSKTATIIYTYTFCLIPSSEGSCIYKANTGDPDKRKKTTKKKQKTSLRQWNAMWCVHTSNADQSKYLQIEVDFVSYATNVNIMLVIAACLDRPAQMRRLICVYCSCICHDCFLFERLTVKPV